MATNSLLLDLMIEIVTNEATGLPTMKAAGEVISGDAEFNIRMADAQGNTTFETMRQAVEAYEAEVAKLRTAWSAFRGAVARDGVFSAEPHEALVRALNETRDKLAKIE